MDFGFSFSIPSKKSETFNQPLKGQPIVLSIFVTNPQNINKLKSLKFIDHKNNDDRSGLITLEKVRDDLYVTKPITLPVGKFKIVVYEENQVNFIVSPSFQAIDPGN